MQSTDDVVRFLYGVQAAPETPAIPNSPKPSSKTGDFASYFKRGFSLLGPLGPNIPIADPTTPLGEVPLAPGEAKVTSALDVAKAFANEPLVTKDMQKTLLKNMAIPRLGPLGPRGTFDLSGVLPTVQSGAGRAVGETVEELTKPSTAGTLAGVGLAAAASPAIEIGAGLGFVGMAALDMWDAAKAAYMNTGEERWYNATKMIMDDAVLVGGLGGASKGFNRAAINSLSDAIPESGNLGKLIAQTRQLFDPVGNSDTALAHVLNQRQSMAKLDAQRQILKHQFEKASVYLDKNGNVPTPEIETQLKALDTVLNEKLDRLPVTEQQRIFAMEHPKNAIDETLFKIFEADKVLENARATTVARENGFVVQAKKLADAPLGWKRINYPATRFTIETGTPVAEGFRVFNTENGKLVDWFATEADAAAKADKNPKWDYQPTDAQPGGSTLKGSKRLYAPPEIAELYKRQLGPGLDKMSVIGPAYNIYRGLGNALNQFQLGFSLFHLSFVTMDSMISGTALGLRKIMAGQYAEGAAQLFKGAAPYYSLKTVLEGGRFRKAVLNGEMTRELDLLTRSGGRLKQDPFNYANGFEPARKAAMRAYREGSVGATLGWSLMAIPELASYHMMEKIVPNMKLGMFLDMAKFQMGEFARKGASDFEVRKGLSEIWDSVDNRMGQIVYDNLFWNKAMKQLGMASIRSLGWNIGTFREVGGGIKDWGSFLSTPLKEAKFRNPQLTWRMTYTAMMPVLVGLYGGMIHYASGLMAGKTPDAALPKTLDDFYFPENASGNRMSLPSYMKDVIEVTQDPVNTFLNKTHPLARGIVDILGNRDFRNVHLTEENLFEDILDRDAQGIGQWFKDMGTYGGKQLLPFGLVGMKRLMEEGTPPREAIGALAGFPPAPMRVTGSEFEQYAKRQIGEGSPEGGRSKLQAAVSTAKLAIEDRLRKGRDVGGLVADAVDAGLLKPDDISQILKDITLSQAQSLAQRLPFSEFIRAFNLGTDEEKTVLMPVLIKKYESIPNMRPAELKEALRMIAKIKWPTQKPLPPPPG